ncbi:hypothetical protein EVAR_102700_1 [Eumeta japonica]|uniref:Uncharacterized protein n=1 Tax=Eumeta variegata TaxID=151549 RepID=A0A4C1THQ6_EUMVA|nr:hypothetical protein EVAR_102700_1 [Eumeta japonica]
MGNLPSVRPGARGVYDSHGLKNLLKRHDNGSAVSPKTLTSSSEAAGDIEMLTARDCPMGGDVGCVGTLRSIFVPCFDEHIASGRRRRDRPRAESKRLWEDAPWPWSAVVSQALLREACGWGQRTEILK